MNAWRKDGTPFLSNAACRAITATGPRSAGEPEYRRSVEARQVSDRLGAGWQLIARCADDRRQLDFEVRAALYDGRNALIVETICRNTSGKDLLVQRVEPVRAVFDEGAACHWQGASKVLTNGYMYYDPGRVEEFGWIDRNGSQSMWNMGLYRGDREEGLVIGFLENGIADGRISAWNDNTVLRRHAGFALVAESLYNQECVLKPGASKTSGRLIFNLASDPFTALESYAQAVADLHQVRLNPIVNGWCSWFYTHERYVSEQEIVRNTEFAARHLKPYGLEYIQIDDGYQRAYGDWEGNEHFPQGMKWLASRIRELGLKAGIWLAPYVIAEGTEVFEKHPEWLIRNLDGKTKQCGGGATGEAALESPQFVRKLYGLDITHPGAAEWMRQLLDRIANDWGYDFIKIDFVEWTILAADRYYDPTFSKAAAYRKGFEIMRQTVGPHRHLLDCGPMNNTVGLLDSTRIELDLAYLTWEQYVKNFNSNAPAMAKRYYFHQRTWLNDDDHLGLALLTIPQAQAAATIIALSGGTMISGDRLTDLDPVRLEILRKVFPSYGQAARPVDLFDRDKPEIFALPVKKDFGDWTLAALFNYEEQASSTKEVALERLRLDPAKTYLAYDFWREQLLGEVRETLRAGLQPASVALLAVHEKRNIPQVVSTSRHFTQGAIELEAVAWDSSSKVLRAVSLGPPGSSHYVSIYIPLSFRWAQQLPAYFYDFKGYTLKLAEPQVLRVLVHCDGAGRVPWEVRFKAI